MVFLVEFPGNTGHFYLVLNIAFLVEKCIFFLLFITGDLWVDVAPKNFSPFCLLLYKKENRSNHVIFVILVSTFGGYGGHTSGREKNRTIYLPISKMKDIFHKKGGACTSVLCEQN